VELFARDAATFTVSTDPTNSYVTGFEQRLPIRDKNGLHTRYELRRFPPQDIVWIVLNPGTDTQYGYPIIETIVNEVSALLFSMKSIARYFTHDEIPPGILVFGRLGKEAFDRAKEWFRSRRGEEGKRELPMFWDVESASYIPFQRPFREMQLAELSAQIERIVFRNFGVTSLEMGMTQDVNRATSFSLERLSHSKLIAPLREMLSFFITQDIIWELHPGLQFKFSIGSYGDMPQIAASLVTLAGGPIISVNEAREEIGKESLEGFDFMTVHSGGQMVSQKTAEEKALKKDRGAVAQEITSELNNGLPQADTSGEEEITRARSGLNAREYKKGLNALEDAFRKALEKEWLRLESEIVELLTESITAPGESMSRQRLNQIYDLLSDENLEKRFGPISEKYFGRSAHLGNRRAVTQFRHPTTSNKEWYEGVGRDESLTFKESLLDRIKRFRERNQGNLEGGVGLARGIVARFGLKGLKERLEELIKDQYNPFFVVTEGLEGVRSFFDLASQALGHGGWKSFLKAAAEDGRKVYWIMQEGEDHCTPEKAAEYGYDWSCPELEEKSESEDGLDPEWLLENDLTPRSGETPCGAHCYCRLEIGPEKGPVLTAIAKEALETLALGAFFNPRTAARVLNIPQNAARAVTDEEIELIKRVLADLHDDILKKARNVPITVITDERRYANQAHSIVIQGKEVGLRGKNRDKLFATFSIPKNTWKNLDERYWQIQHEYIHTTIVHPKLRGAEARLREYYKGMVDRGIEPTAHAFSEGRNRHGWIQRIWSRLWPHPVALDEDVTQVLELYDPILTRWAQNLVDASRRYPGHYGTWDQRPYTLEQARKKVRLVKKIFL
jgi:hypothetical protein